MTFDEAQAQLTAPGARFEIKNAWILGRQSKVFANTPTSLRDIVQSAHARGDDTFLVYQGERWTFRDWAERVDAFAAGLAHHYGVSKGDRVAIAMRNFPEWIVSWGAAISLGAIAVSLNAWWTTEELDFALDDCTPSVVVADIERVERMSTSCALRAIPLIGARIEARGGLASVVRFEDVLIEDTKPPHVDIAPDDDATILYTSGTTGTAKGAVSTHRAVLSALMAFGLRSAIEKLRTSGNSESEKRPSPRPVFILIVPLFHVTGSVPVMLSCLSGGLKLVMMHHWDAEQALALIEAERVTNFVGVPTQSHDLMQSPKFAEFDTSSLVSVGGGGAPTPSAQVAQVDSSFAQAKPNIGYGMTETNAYGPGNSGADYLARPSSTGRLVAIANIQARDDHGNALAVGETGELWMTGPQLIRGYWNRPEETNNAIVDGWLRTGDIGHVDDEGFVFISDRAKDMVLRGGENVYCAEVEDAIYLHPGVHEAAVFGVPDDRLGEKVVAAVHCKSGTQIDEDELRDFVAQRLAAFKIPAHIMFCDEPLPKNAAGKFLKRTLRDSFE